MRVGRWYFFMTDERPAFVTHGKGILCSGECSGKLWACYSVCSVTCQHFVRPWHKIYFIIKSTERLSLPWQPWKVTIWFFKDFLRHRRSWTKPFSRGGVVKKSALLLNFHLGRKIFPSLTKSRACFEILNIWQESQFIWLIFTIETNRQDHVVKIWIAKE